MKDKLTKEQWIQKAYEHFIKRLFNPGDPVPENVQRNLRDAAIATAEGDPEWGFPGAYAEGETPEEAVDYEIECGC